VNSYSFCERLKTVNLTPDDVLISLDVVSLFPSIPPSFAIETVKDTLKTPPAADLNTSLFSVTQIVQLLEFILSSTAFLFNGTYYSQVCGVPMGSPISPVIADIVMERIEKTALAGLISHPSLYVRYVDDCFLILARALIDAVLHAFNSVHSSFRFTLELEHDNQLPFLDVLVQRSGNSLITSVHRKPTHSDRYLSFESAHPLSQKGAVVSSLVRRALLIPSTEELRLQELKTVVQVLQSNGYPLRFIHSCINKVKNNLRVHADAEPPACTPVRRVVTQYLPGVSERISRSIRKFSLQPVFVPGRRLRSFMPLVKDSVSDSEVAGVVYGVPCQNCNVEYVGETKRKLSTRLKEHMSDVKHFRRSTALSEHSVDTEHRFDFNSARVLHRATGYQQRTFVEAWEIQQRRLSGHACCNSSSGRLQIPSEYTLLFSSPNRP
jgi:hypothetical protein